MKRKVEIIKPAAGSRATGENIEARLISAATLRQMREKKGLPPCHRLVLCGFNIHHCSALLLCGDNYGHCPNLWFSDAGQSRKPQKQK